MKIKRICSPLLAYAPVTRRKVALRISSLFLLFALMAPGLYAQPGTWAIGMGGLNLEMAEDLEVDSQGNSYISGAFKDTLLIGDTSLVSMGKNDIFLAKFDVNGDFLWARAYGWHSNEFAHALALDESLGRIYLGGEYQDSTIIGTDTLTTWFPGGNFNLIIAWVDLNGNYLGIREDGGSGSDFLWDLSVGEDHNIALSGMFRSNLFLGPDTLFQRGIEDAYIARMDSGGNILWSFNPGSRRFDGGTACDVLQDSIYTLAGFFQDTCWFADDSTEFVPSNGKQDFFVSKFDSAGTFQWAVSGGGPYQDRACAMKMDANRNIYVTGFFDSLMTFQGNNLLSEGKLDGFLLKLDPLGGLIWAKNIGGSEFDAINDLAILPNGNIVCTGYFQDTIVVGTDTLRATQSADQEVFVAAFDPATGNAIWGRSAGGVSRDAGEAIGTDPNGFIYTYGSFTDNAHFGQTSLPSTGAADLFLFRMTQEGSVSIPKEFLAQTGLLRWQHYPNPAESQSRVRIELEKAENISLDILDLQGRVLKGLVQGAKFPKGVREIEVNLTGLASGMYFYRLRVGSAVLMSKLLVD